VTPSAAIAQLDRALARNGQDITLQRLTLGPNGQQIAFSVGCRAMVTGYQASELIAGSGIVQGDSHVILSPTEINEAQWPGPSIVAAGGAAPGTDARVPSKSRGDRCVIAGKARAVEAGTPFYIDGELVRIELQVKG